MSQINADVVGSAPAVDSRRLGLLRKLARTTDNPQADGPKFQRVLNQLGRRIDPADKQAVRNAATLLVSQLFFAPLLAEARELPFGGTVGDGGRGEEVFGEQLDQRIADIVAANLPGLTNQIEAKLTARGGAASDEAEGAAKGAAAQEAAASDAGNNSAAATPAAASALSADDGGRWPLLMKLLERVSQSTGSAAGGVQEVGRIQ